VADRLPSIHDDTTGTTQTTPGASTPGGVLPKPIPTIHPDRYSPGSTPPATDLKPGAPDRNNPASVSSPSPTTAPQSTPAKPPKPQPPTGSTPPPNPQP
jgi:rod shape-determining protein MreC